MYRLQKDGGYNWTKINVNIKTVPQGLYVSRVMPSMYKESRVYANRPMDTTMIILQRTYFVRRGLWNHLGTIGTDLPAEPLNVVKEDPKKKISYT